MKTTNNNGHRLLAHGLQELCKLARRIPRVIVLTAMAVAATCSTSLAQSIIGSSGAGFQTWKAANLNNNSAPYWDAVTQDYLAGC